MRSPTPRPGPGSVDDLTRDIATPIMKSSVAEALVKASYRGAVHDAIAEAMHCRRRARGADSVRTSAATAARTRCRRDCSRSSGRSASATPRSQVGVRRHRHRRRPQRPAAHRRGDDRQLQPAGLDQIVNTASALRHMSNGQFSVPMVVRMATGAGRQLAAQHSHSLENWYAHIPGITVLAPATVADAYGMLRTALTSPDPVIIFEHVGLYNASTDLDELVPTAISGPRSAATGPTPRSSPTAAACPRSSTPPNNWRRPGSTARSSICGCCGRWTTRPSWSRCGGRTAR